MVHVSIIVDYTRDRLRSESLLPMHIELNFFDDYFSFVVKCTRVYSSFERDGKIEPIFGTNSSITLAAIYITRIVGLKNVQMRRAVIGLEFQEMENSWDPLDFSFYLCT